MMKKQQKVYITPQTEVLDLFAGDVCVQWPAHAYMGVFANSPGEIWGEDDDYRW